jgi:hypothetical protein
MPSARPAGHSSALPAHLQPTSANPQKGYQSREGIQLLFDDEKKSVSLITPGGNSLVLSDDDQGITLKDQNGNKIVLGPDGRPLAALGAGGGYRIIGYVANALLPVWVTIQLLWAGFVSSTSAMPVWWKARARAALCGCVRGALTRPACSRRSGSRTSTSCATRGGRSWSTSSAGRRATRCGWTARRCWSTTT